MSSSGSRWALLACLLAAVVFPVCSGAAPQSDMDEARGEMVERQIEARGVEDPCVLAAMRSVPRHLFLPEEARPEAHLDRPVRIAEGQTMSQPYIVALMTELLELEPGDRVLEIGTGSGYHAAVLSRCAGRIYTIEILEPLGQSARATLERLGYDNVVVRIGDGYQGWPEEAPFDAVILTAAPPKIPAPLIEQLAVGGRLVAPVGDVFQDLQLLRKTEDGIEVESVAPVRFVPMVGEARDGGR